MQAMESIATPILILILLELLEAWWQRSETLFALLQRTWYYYRKSIFLFFSMHPSFYYILFIILLSGVLNGWMVAILFFKIVDIFFKVILMQRVFVEKELDSTLEAMLYEPLSPWLFLTGATLYPSLLFYALS